MASYYPPVAFSFAVSLSPGRVPNDADFQEVSGMSSTVAVEEVRESPPMTHALPSPVRENVVLKRGVVLTASPVLAWCRETLEAGLDTPISPATVYIALLDQNRNRTIEWTLQQSYPVNWAVNSLSASQDVVYVDHLELAYRRIERLPTVSLPGRAGTLPSV